MGTMATHSDGMTLDTKILIGVGGLAILFGVGALAMSYYEDAPDLNQIETAQSLAPQGLVPIALAPDELAAKAAIVYEPASGRVLYGKNTEEQLPLASLTKLATALAVLSQDENRLVTVTAEALAEEGDSGLSVGDLWRLGDLVAFGLTTSSNDAMAAAAQALTREETVAKMNRDAKAYGMAQSYFLNPTGLDISSSTAGAYGSARDVAYLVTALLTRHSSIFEATAYAPEPEGDSGKGAQSTLTPLASLPGLIAAKTGYTDLAGGNLAVAADIGLSEPVVVVVLGSTIDGRFEDAQKLIKAVAAARDN
jgi:D-alanyl-D-alanine carboxypeptidase